MHYCGCIERLLDVPASVAQAAAVVWRAWSLQCQVCRRPDRECECDFGAVTDAFHVTTRANGRRYCPACFARAEQRECMCAVVLLQCRRRRATYIPRPANLRVQAPAQHHTSSSPPPSTIDEWTGEVIQMPYGCR
jgi:hypothetical protein